MFRAVLLFNLNEMTYKEYINIGFKRTDIRCGVEFNRTGYHGYYLTYELNKNSSIEVNSGDLDNPKLFIKKHGAGKFFILPLTPEQVIGLLK